MSFFLWNGKHRGTILFAMALSFANQNPCFQLLGGFHPMLFYSMMLPNYEIRNVVFTW